MFGINKLFEYRSSLISSGFYWLINLDEHYSDLFSGEIGYGLIGLLNWFSSTLHGIELEPDNYEPELSFYGY